MLTLLFTFVFLSGPALGQNPLSLEQTAKLATAAAHRGDYATSAALLTTALDCFSGTPNTPALTLLYSSRGLALAGMGDYRGAESDLRHAYQLEAAVTGDSDPHLAVHLANLAFSLMLQNKLDQAELALIRSRALLEKTAGENQPVKIQILSELASVYAAEGKFRAAEECGESALRIVERRWGSASEDAAMSWVNLANVYLQANQLEQAERILPEAVAMERRLLANRRILTEGIYRLAELRAKQKRWNDARPLYEEAISLYAALLGTEHPDYAAVVRQYGEVQKHLKKGRMAEGLQTKASLPDRAW